MNAGVSTFLPTSAILMVVVGCGQPPAPHTDGVALDEGVLDAGVLQQGDAGEPVEVAPVSDATNPEDAGPPPPTTAPASEYCERAVDVFCPYYLRCDRMAVPDLAGCRTAFLEACNGVYEPIYDALEKSGALELSLSGLDTCAQHLGSVSCDAHVFDLEGGCRDVWTGLVGSGGVCGSGIETHSAKGSSPNCSKNCTVCPATSPVE